jgi:hypothetical protein
MVIPSLNGNSRVAKITVILPIKPCSLDEIGNYHFQQTLIGNYCIVQIALLLSDYCSITKFSSVKQVTDSNRW